MGAKRIVSILVRCVVVVIIGATGYSVAVGAYQEFRLSCRPNCARVDLSGVSLYRPYPSADPEMGILSIHMRQVNFRGADLSQADLRGVSVRMCDFRDANLESANLRDTDFAWADLAGVNLGNAYMFKANLYDTDLTGANLEDADLTEAYMIEADLTGADLERVKLTGARYDGNTKWPEGFDPDQAGAIYLETETAE